MKQSHFEQSVFTDKNNDFGKKYVSYTFENMKTLCHWDKIS